MFDVMTCDIRSHIRANDLIVFMQNVVMVVMRIVARAVNEM